MINLFRFYFSSSNFLGVRYFSSVKLSFTTLQNKNSIKIEKSLFIIHGLLGSKQNWNSISKNLSSYFKDVVTVDLRNHGDSDHNNDISIEAMTEDVRRLIESAQYKNPILLGHSLGGKVAMYLALLHPNLLKSLVVVDVAPEKTLQIGQYKVYIEAMLSANIDQNVSLPSNRKNIDVHLSKVIEESDIRSFILTNLIRDDAKKIIKWRVNLQALRNGLEQLIEFPCPEKGVFEGDTLFISGGKSNYIRKDHWPRIKTLFPEAYLEVIEDAGHWVHADKPHQFINALITFASKVKE